MGFPRNDFLTEARKLGHSEEYISEALTYVGVLETKGLPIIFDQRHLSFLLCKEYRKLKWLMKSVSSYYKYFAIKKRRGGLRRIMSPYSELRDVQVWVKENILDKVIQLDYVTAFAKGRNILGNAKLHEDRN